MKKGVVFHLVPENLEGTILYPLNSLRTIHPDLYTKAAKKYSLRESIMHQKVSPLGCVWSDVIHLTPLHPKFTFAAISKYIPSNSNRVFRFFEIPLSLLDPEKSCWFSPDPNAIDRHTELRPQEFSSIKEFRQLQEVPAPQLDRWERDIALGRQLLLWSQTPHVLYANEISVAGLNRIEVTLK